MGNAMVVEALKVLPTTPYMDAKYDSDDCFGQARGPVPTGDGVERAIDPRSLRVMGLGYLLA